MAFPSITITSGTQAQTELVNRAAEQGITQPTGGLGQTDFLAACVANMLVESPDLAVTPAALSAVLGGSADGLGLLRVARVTFNPSLTAGQRTIAAHDLGVTIPDKAIVVGGFIQVNTTFTSATDAATIAISVQAANDIVTATAISGGGNIWDAGKQAIVPKANTPETTGVVLTAARAITATVAVEALTAGKATIFLYYVVGA